MVNFVWDADKASQNLRKHKVAFDEAVTVFRDPLSITVPDPDHSVEEERYIDIGMSDKGQILVVVYAEVNLIRIISSRKATRSERRQYESGED